MFTNHNSPVCLVDECHCQPETGLQRGYWAHAVTQLRYLITALGTSGPQVRRSVLSLVFGALSAAFDTVDVPPSIFEVLSQ